MLVIPAIDLKDGQCVRLFKGDFGSVHKVADDPYLLADDLINKGARCIHMVDLDGAKDGTGKNREVIKRIASKYPGVVETGGGIRDMASIDELIASGVSRVILGSIAVESPEFVREAVERYGSRIAVGIDSSNGEVMTHGWLKGSGIDAVTFAKGMSDLGVITFIATDISRDGMLSGYNIEYLSSLKAATGGKIIASGGASSMTDLISARDGGLFGAIVGKAMYTGDIDISEALAIQAQGEI